MTTKNMLTLIGLLHGLQGIGIFFGAEAITMEAFALWKPDATGVRIGTMLHEAMGVICLMVAIILFFAVYGVLVNWRPHATGGLFSYE